MATSRVRQVLTDGRQRARQHVHRFVLWWLQELRASLPSRLVNWLIEDGSRTLVLVPADGNIVFQLVSDTRRAVAHAVCDGPEYSPQRIDEFLRQHRLDRRSVSLGVRMPAASVFFRSFVLPLEAGRRLEATILSDLATRTPFVLDDIVHAHEVGKGAGRFHVSQWVVRNKHVDELLHALGLQRDNVAFLELADPVQTPTPPRLNLSPTRSRSRGLRRACLVLTCSATLLATAAVGLNYQYQQRQLDTLTREIAKARAKAQAVLADAEDGKKLAAAAQELRTLRAGAGLLDIWKEVTRLLPEHSWATELRVSNTGERTQVTVVGLSAGAASLVALFDRGPLFGGAMLVGPISADPSEDRERFTLQFAVQSGPMSKAASP